MATVVFIIFFGLLILVTIALLNNIEKTSSVYQSERQTRTPETIKQNEFEKRQAINSLMREVWSPLRIALNHYKSTTDVNYVPTTPITLVFRNKSISDVYLLFNVYDRLINLEFDKVYKYQNGSFQFVRSILPKSGYTLFDLEEMVLNIGGYHKYDQHYILSLNFSDDCENIVFGCGGRVVRSLSESKWRDLD